jgi:hypothetical protein
LETVNFLATANEKGIQRLQVEVEVLGGEFSKKNNQQEIFVEVIDGKQKILLLGLAPHPDLKAIKAILDKNENLSVETVTLTQNQSPDFGNQDFDLIILHQLPDAYNNGPVFIKRYIDQNVPLFFILGNQGSTAQMNAINKGVDIQAAQTDKVTGVFNPNFKSLNIEPASMEVLKRLPQISVPFGDYRLAPNTEVILFQRVGSLTTQKPLFTVTTGATKTATFFGEGLWQWRLEEYNLTEKQEAVDELFLKVVQLIAGKEDKRKLRVYATSNLYKLGEKVTFETEMYNGIYEKLHDIPVKLELRNEKNVLRTYNYRPSQNNSRFEISDLPEGLYRYRATATILGQPEESEGRLLVQDIDFESQNLVADFNLLRSLSQQSGGLFARASELAAISSKIANQKTPDRIESSEDLREIINLRWLFFVLLGLLTLEWILRKYAGGY